LRAATRNPEVFGLEQVKEGGNIVYQMDETSDDSIVAKREKLIIEGMIDNYAVDIF
jgi:hypothetical protein